MKIKDQIIALLLGSIALVACMPRTVDGPSKAFDPVLYIDSMTGCNYLSTGNSASLTPRIAADGRTHMGCDRGVK